MTIFMKFTQERGFSTNFFLLTVEQCTKLEFDSKIMLDKSWFSKFLGAIASRFGKPGLKRLNFYVVIVGSKNWRYLICFFFVLNFKFLSIFIFTLFKRIFQILDAIASRIQLWDVIMYTFLKTKKLDTIVFGIFFLKKNRFLASFWIINFKTTKNETICHF